MSGYGNESTSIVSLDYYAAGRHFSLIKNLRNYFSVYKCPDCGFMVSKEFKLRKHFLRVKKCTEEEQGPRARFLGGTFGSHNLNLFEKLEQRGIRVSKEKFASDFSIWDFESITIENRVKCGENTTLEGELVPISCAVSSTGFGFRISKFFLIDTTPRELVDRILNYLMKVQKTGYENRVSEFSWIFEEIDSRTNQLTEKLTNQKDEEVIEYVKSEIEVWNRLRNELDTHCSEHVVFGWNSSRFDIQLIRGDLFASLAQMGLPVSYIVKKQASYAYIKAGGLIFRDAQHLVSPGISLKNFLLSQKPVGSLDFLGKLIFPHDWLCNLNQLYEQTSFPEKDCFYSKLRNEHVNEDEYSRNKKLFESSNCKNMRNWLEIYNIAYCSELRDAMEGLKMFWENLGFSILFDGISLSALAEKLSHKSINEPCLLWMPANKRDQLIYEEINKSIVGGPSIVFHRKCIQNETVIGVQKVQNVLGLDQNSLYLGCMGSDMPTGIPAVFDINENGFFSRTWHLPYGSSLGEYRFCFWLQYRENLTNLLHRFNRGQVRIGKMTPDACDLENKILYQFYGCYIHAHENCKLYDETKVNPDDLLKKRAKRIESENYYRKLGFVVKFCFECQFNEKVWKVDREFRRWFSKNHMLPQWYQNKITLTKLLKLIQDDKMFGLLCDVTIDVPSELEEKFDAFCPLFYHAEISRDDVGDFMKNYLVKQNRLKKPRRTLISGMHGKGLNLSSQLIQFYMSQGLVISKATRFIQWIPKKIFKPFTNLVTEKRKAAETDGKLKIIGENMKLIGNGAYGRSLLKKQDYVKYLLLTDEKKLRLKVNNPRFKSAEAFEKKNVYEISMIQSFYRETVPRYIGAFVLSQAKLEMLKFYYLFWQVFMDKKKYQLCQMDTDSLYIAIAEKSIIGLVKPEKMDLFMQVKDNWMVNPSIIGDSKTPLKMKVEFWGSSIVALCPKMYYTWTITETEYQQSIQMAMNDNSLTDMEKADAIEKLKKSWTNVKSAMKGTSKKINKLSEHHYLSVIDKQKTVYTENRGFRLGFIDSKLHSYSSIKAGLIYDYIKREVQPDGVSTKCLKGF